MSFIRRISGHVSARSGQISMLQVANILTERDSNPCKTCCVDRCDFLLSLESMTEPNNVLGQLAVWLGLSHGHVVISFFNYLIPRRSHQLPSRLSSYSPFQSNFSQCHIPKPGVLSRHRHRSCSLQRAAQSASLLSDCLKWS